MALPGGEVVVVVVCGLVPVGTTSRDAGDRVEGGEEIAGEVEVAGPGGGGGAGGVAG